VAISEVIFRGETFLEKGFPPVPLSKDF